MTRPARWDPGLQPERTALAWVRTGLAITVVSLLAGRLAAGSGPLATLLALGGTAVAAVVVGSQSGGHRRRGSRLHEGTMAPAVGAVAATTVLVLGLCGASLGVILLR